MLALGSVQDSVAGFPQRAPRARLDRTRDRAHYRESAGAGDIANRRSAPPERRQDHYRRESMMEQNPYAGGRPIVTPRHLLDHALSRTRGASTFGGT